MRNATVCFYQDTTIKRLPDLIKGVESDHDKALIIVRSVNVRYWNSYMFVAAGKKSNPYVDNIAFFTTFPALHRINMQLRLCDLRPISHGAWSS